MCNVHYNGKGSNLTDDEALTILRRGGWGDDDGPGGDWGDCAFADCDDATRAEYRAHAMDLLADEELRRFRTQRVGPGDLIQSGVPPALPGRQPPFDISRG